MKSVKVGDRPRGIGFLPDGSRAYVAAENADTVNVFDTKTHDGKKLYVACGRSDAVAVVDTTENRKVADIPVGSLPWGVVIR